MNFNHPAWRKHPARTAVRVFKSLVRIAVPALRNPAADHDGGRSRVYADLSTPLGLQLYRYGIGGPELDLLRLLLRPGDLFVDGGANVGLFTLVAAARVGPGGKVIAFEPAAQTRAVLLANVALNGFSWVELRSEALDAQGGDRQLVAFDGQRSGLSSFQPKSVTGGNVERVVTTTLDDAVKGADRARLRVLKLDLEGAEYAALLGARELLTEAPPDLIIEVEPDHLARQGASAGALAAFLRGFGYEFYQPMSSPDGGVELTPVIDPTAPRESPDLFATAVPSRARGSGVLVRS